MDLRIHYITHQYLSIFIHIFKNVFISFLNIKPGTK